MGLTIGYKLYTRRRLSSARVKQIIQPLRAVAQELGFEIVGELRPTDPTGFRFLYAPRKAKTISELVPPAEGWVFSAVPGEGSESIEVGLCRYPGLAGWRLRGWCKTQYASHHGWEHFRDCHHRAVDLLRACQRAGLTVQVQDEGRYWGTRDDWFLCRKIREYDQMMAALGGALKDAFGNEQPAAPIYSHPQFERLEAEGAARHRDRLPALVAATRQVLGDTAKG